MLTKSIAPRVGGGAGSPRTTETGVDTKAASTGRLAFSAGDLVADAEELAPSGPRRRRRPGATASSGRRHQQRREIELLADDALGRAVAELDDDA